MDGSPEGKAEWCMTEYEMALDNVPLLVGLYLACVLRYYRTRFLRALTWRGWREAVKDNNAKKPNEHET